MSPVQLEARPLPGSNVIIKQVDITTTGTWVKLSDTQLIADVQIRPKGNNTVKIRFRSGPEAKLPQDKYEIRGVDLSELEVSTDATNLPQTVIVIGQPVK